MDYQKDLEIDKYALDTECLDQARQFMVWSEGLADAMAERDRIEQKTKVMEAQTEQSIRNNPEGYGGKLTEAGIKSYVITNPEVMQIREESIEATHKVNIIMAAKQAMEQRRSMLENLVKLYLSGYWADPKVKQEDKETIDKGTTKQMKDILNQSPRLKERKK